jgi:phenylalanyl-tRNA synthetase beta subunit
MLEVDVGRSESQGHSLPHRDLELSLDYIRTSVGLDFSKPTLIRVLKRFSFPSTPPTRGWGKERLLGKGDCGPV